MYFCVLKTRFFLSGAKAGVQCTHNACTTFIMSAAKLSNSDIVYDYLKMKLMAKTNPVRTGNLFPDFLWGKLRVTICNSYFSRDSLKYYNFSTHGTIFKRIKITKKK